MRNPVLGVRADDALLARLDALATYLSERAHGVDVSRSDALRLAAAKGLDFYEQEMRPAAVAAVEHAPAKPKKKGATNPAKKTTPRK